MSTLQPPLFFQLGGEWLGPLFNEQQELRNGRMWVSDRPGLGFSLSDQARAWTVATETFGRP